MRKLPIQVREHTREKDHQRAIDIAHACVILHNLLLEDGDEWDYRDQLIEQPDIGIGGHVEDGAVQGVAFRNAIMGSALAAGRGPRGIITYDQHQQRQRQLQMQQRQQLQDQQRQQRQ